MILMRHGQSEFNVVYSATRTDPGIEDPALTDDGRGQVVEAAAILDRRDVKIRRIIASPYTRALQSAEILAETFAAPISVEPLVRERFAWTCDIGTGSSELVARWPDTVFPEMPERWWPEDTETHNDVHGRATIFHRAMADHPDHQETLVVSHWGFIRAMCGLEVTNATMVRIQSGASVGDAAEVVSHPHP
jgi:broad specificity phosphatase PhoE